MTRTACPDDCRRHLGPDGDCVDEPDADRCEAVLLAATTVAISAGTLAEARIVAGRRSVALQMTRLVEGVGMEVLPVTSATARRIADAYAR
jgi:ribonuclease VapC